MYVPILNVKPGNATLSALKWESSKPEVVEVDENGHFIAKKYGTAVVTATADYGDGNPISASMNVIVAEGKIIFMKIRTHCKTLTDKICKTIGWKIRVF